MTFLRKRRRPDSVAATRLAPEQHANTQPATAYNSGKRAGARGVEHRDDRGDTGRDEEAAGRIMVRREMRGSRP